MSMICSQKDLHKILDNKKHSNQEHAQIVKIIINGGYDMPDCLFEHAYIGHKNDANSDLKYIQLQQIIYNGVEMKMPLNFIRKFYKNLRKSIGDNPYIIRMRKYINYLGSNDINSEIEFKQFENTDFSDTEAKKKIMMICKRKNRMGEYVQYINKYLEREPMDEEAWIELGELYCERANFMKAAFCYEELIVLNPSNDNYTLRLAEIYLTENNKVNLEKAIKYLSFLISKRPDNLRALWVLYRACGSSKGQQYSELQKMCSDAIHKLYSTRNPSLKFHESL